MRKEAEKCLFLLVIFVLLATEAYGKWKPFNPPKYEGETCTTFYSQNWTCQKEIKCHVLTSLKQKGWVQPCSDHGKKSPICCPQLKDLRNVAHPVSRSISDRKCQEYQAKFCTRREQVETNFLIRNGELTEPDQFPYAVRVGYGGSNGQPPLWTCGGVLISEQFVLSAFDCAYSWNLGRARWVRLQGLKHHTFQIEEIFVPKSVNESVPVFYNNIALFLLKTSIEFNKFAAPACIHALPFDVEGTVTAVGWGRIGRDRGFSTNPLKMELDITETNDCKQEAKHFLPKGLDGNTIICAGAKDRNTCQEDSGEPLVWTHSPHCLGHLVGVTSFVPGGCARSEDAPGIYTRVSAFVPWIESIVWPQQEL